MPTLSFQRLAFFALPLLFSCAGDELSRLEDSGPGPADSGADAGLAEDAAALDAAPADAGPAPFPCDVLAPDADPTRPAVLTGRMDIFDFDYWDEQDQRRGRVRNAGVNFLTGNMYVQPTSDAAYYRGITPDGCIAVDVPVPTLPAGPPRNIGTVLVMEDETGIVLRRPRRSDADGVSYLFFENLDQQSQFFDPARVAIGRRWIWSTPGDPAAGIRPARAVVEPVEDFEVTPAITSTGAPLVIDPAAGVTISWTAPVQTPAELSIVLARALNPEGDGRYLICRPADDGSFTVPAAAIADFGPVAGLPFDLVVTRAQVAPFCNEGVPRGAAKHAIIYLGAGIVN